LIGGIHAIGGLLQEPAEQLVGGLEERGAQEDLQLLHVRPELRHQLLDFGFLGEKDFRGGRFFF